MEVVALLGFAQYECEELLGVYASREDAVAAARVSAQAAIALGDESEYEEYVLQYRTLGGVAFSGFLRSDVRRECINAEVF